MITVKESTASLFIFLFLIGGVELASRTFIQFYHPELPLNISATVSIGKYLRKVLLANSSNNVDFVPDLESYINSENDLEKTLTDFSDNGIGLANTPYDQLISDRIRTIKTDSDGILKNKSGSRRYVRLLRSRVFNPWDPVIFNSGFESEKDPTIQMFIDKYALKAKIQSSDSEGFRTTLPVVESEEIIFVIGDSVAFGASLSDHETLASQLQKKYPNVRFINDSIGGGKASDNRDRLKKRLEHFEKKVIGVIYVHTENDVTSADTPKDIVEDLNEILNIYKIQYRAFVHQVYIYQSMPDLLRGKFFVKFGNNKILMGRDENDLVKFFKFKQETINLAKAHGFYTVDFSEVVNKFRAEKGTPFAGFSLYVDHAHFSAEGTTLVADELKKTLDIFINTNIEKMNL